MATVVLAPLLPTLYSILQNPGKTMVLPFLPFVAALISVLLKLKWIQERKAAKKYLNWIDLEMTMHIFMLKTALMDWLILVMSGSIMTKVEGKYMKEAMVNKIAATTYSWSMSCHMFVKYVNHMRLRAFSFLFVKVHIFWEGHKILQNFYLTFDCMDCSQK